MYSQFMMHGQKNIKLPKFSVTFYQPTGHYVSEGSVSSSAQLL